MCSITGYSSSTQDPIGGGVGTQRSSMGFTLYYVGGVPIGSCEFDQDSEACDSLYYKGTTIPASMLNSASDIQVSFARDGRGRKEEIFFQQSRASVNMEKKLTQWGNVVDSGCRSLWVWGLQH